MTDDRRNKYIRRKALDLAGIGRSVELMPPSPPHRSRAKLFGSPVFEAFTLVSLRAFVVVWTILLPAILVIAVQYAPTVWAPLLIVAGALGWTLAEYGLHRYVFHFKARSATLQRLIFIIHGNHHEVPNDPLRNLMPPVVSVPVGLLVWGLCIGLMGPLGTWCFLGFMLGYVGYDLVHYACHQLPMKGRLSRLLKVHHMRHHHLQADGNYAITGMVWDRLLSTRVAAGRGKS